MSPVPEQSDDSDELGNVPQPEDTDKATYADRQDRSKELEQSESKVNPASQASTQSSEISADTGIPGLGSVRGLVQATFFMDLFCYHADRRFRHKEPQARVATLVQAAPRFYKFCLSADVVFRAMTMVILLTALTMVIFFTIAKVFGS